MHALKHKLVLHVLNAQDPFTAVYVLPPLPQKGAHPRVHLVKVEVAPADYANATYTAVVVVRVCSVIIQKAWVCYHNLVEVKRADSEKLF
jgi:hypothetical protein